MIAILFGSKPKEVARLYIATVECHRLFEYCLRLGSHHSIRGEHQRFAKRS